MIKRPLRNLTAAAILAGATHGAIAQTPMPQTPTTKILAVGTFAPGTDMSQVQRILPTEVRETAQLYLDGKIDQWYSLEEIVDRAVLSLKDASPFLFDRVKN